MPATSDRSEGARARSAPADGPETAAADAPLVSVVVTTYNRPSYLRSAVESVRDQTYAPIELVVVDDHSPRPAEAVLDGMDLTGLTAVQCVRHAENRGANAARNTGLDHVSGEYVAFLDDDDRWRPEKVARQVSALQSAGEDVGVVYCGVEAVGADGNAVRTPDRVDGDMTRALLCRNVVGSLSVVMVRTEVATDVRLDEAFPAWADLEWYVRLSRRTGFLRLPDPLTVYEFTSHGRLSEDLEKKLESYELFLDRFDALARTYGRLFRRKMRAWAAFRIGKSGLLTREYGTARRFFGTAIATYPFEPAFYPYFVGTVGGRFTHGLARTVKRITT